MHAHYTCTHTHTHACTHTHARMSWPHRLKINQNNYWGVLLPFDVALQAYTHTVHAVDPLLERHKLPFRLLHEDITILGKCIWNFTYPLCRKEGGVGEGRRGGRGKAGRQGGGVGRNVVYYWGHVTTACKTCDSHSWQCSSCQSISAVHHSLQSC